MPTVILPPGKVLLTQWNIIEIEETDSTHFVGYSLNDELGRVSTEIVGYDKAKKVWKTRSGSLYKLIGKAGAVHPDALYVLGITASHGLFNYKWVFPVE